MNQQKKQKTILVDNMKSILFLTLFFSQLFCSQTNLISHDTSIYQLNNEIIELKTTSLYNKYDENLIVWLSKNKKEDYKSYFSKKGDFSLLEWLNDDNFSDYTIDVYSTFLKVVKPKESFIILYKGNAPVINYICENELPQYIRKTILRVEKDTNFKLYKSNYIFIKE